MSEKNPFDDNANLPKEAVTQDAHMDRYLLADVPAQYQGMSPDAVEELWVVPYYTDPKQTEKELDWKRRVLQKMRGELSTDNKLEQQRQRDHARLEEVRANLNIDTGGAGDKGESNKTLERMLAVVDTYSGKMQALMRQAPRSGDWDNDEIFMRNFRDIVPDTEQVAEAAVAIAAALKAEGSKDPMIDRWEEDVRVSLIKIREYSQGVYMVNTDVQKAMYGVNNSTKSLVALYRKNHS